MVIKWQDAATVDRAIAALFAAHPDFTPDYQKMSEYFGEPATYDSLQSHFRKYRSMAGKMIPNPSQSAASTPSRRKKGPGAPSTPRSNKVGVAKSRSTRKSHGSRPLPDTPTKKGKPRTRTISEAIVLEDDDGELEGISLKDGASPKTQKMSSETSAGNAARSFKRELATTPIDLEFIDVREENRSIVDKRPHAYLEQNENTEARQLDWVEELENSFHHQEFYDGYNICTEFDDIA